MLTRTARILVLPSFALLVALALAAPAGAIPVSVSSFNLPTCDPLSGSPNDELGNPPAFPPGEAIASSDVEDPRIACMPTDTGAANFLVSITNLTSRSFADVWYVSDPETSLSNVDGLMNGEEAFKIDYAGINSPLKLEIGGIPGDAIFQPGETWDFIIDDYFNTLALPASAFGSAALVGVLSGGDGVSSGSIVVPEPGTFLLAGLGLAGLALLARRRLKA